MKRLGLFFIVLILTNAQLSCEHKGKADQEKRVTLKSPQIINFEPQFKVFWQRAKNQTFEMKVELWTALVESPHQHFFDTFVWSDKQDPTFSDRRLKQLRIIFDRIDKHETKINDDLSSFESVVSTQIDRYRKTFTDAEFPVNCYAVVGGNFLGRAGSSAKTKEKVLAFGIDKIADMDVNPDIIYSHELFHIYHGIKSNIDSDERMIAQLWSEGLASFVSHELNPTASKKDVFIYESVSKLSDGQLPKISAQFLAVANKRASDTDGADIYFNWFLSEKDTGELPVMAGCWLGYKVAESLRTQYSLDQMSKWNSEKAVEVSRSMLKQFAEINY